MMAQLWRVAFWVLLFAVVYLSWKLSPSFADVPWLPAALGRGLDRHDFTKNLIGYGVFALIGFIAWSTPTGFHAAPRGGSIRRSLSNRTLLLCFCLLVVLLELGQLALPHRVCDMADVLACWTGILLAW